MFQVYPVIDVNQKEFLLTIEEFYKDGVPFISAKFHEVANETVDVKNGGTVEQRYSHSYKYYYEKPYSQFSSAAWHAELKDMHNEAMLKEKIAPKLKFKKFKINRFGNLKLREAEKRSKNKKDDDQREA